MKKYSRVISLIYLEFSVYSLQICGKKKLDRTQILFSILSVTQISSVYCFVIAGKKNCKMRVFSFSTVGSAVINLNRKRFLSYYGTVRTLFFQNTKTVQAICAVNTEREKCVSQRRYGLGDKLRPPNCILKLVINKLAF